MCGNHRRLSVKEKVGRGRNLDENPRHQLLDIINEQEGPSNPLITAVSLLASLAPEERIYITTGTDQETELNKTYKLWQRQVITALAAIFQIKPSADEVKERLTKAGVDKNNLPKFLQ